MKKSFKRIVSIGLACAVLFSAGCSAEKNPVEGSGRQEEGTKKADAQPSPSGEKAMGRYIETEIDTLEDSLSTRADLVQMEDGSLVVFDLRNGKFVSTDGGETWEHESLAWFEELRTNTYVLNVAVSPDGYVSVIYEAFDAAEKDAEGKSADGEEASGKDTDAKEAGDGGTPDAEAETSGGSGEELVTDIDYENHPLYKIIAPDGTQLDYEIPYNDSEYVENIKFSNDGRLFGASLGGKIYEINKEDGSYELFTELSSWVYQMKILDNRMACVNKDGITMIDLETKEIIKDNVLDEFVKNELGQTLDPSTRYEVPAIVILEEEILYLIVTKGIYRHVIGGNLVEQIADGSLTTLGNPSYKIRDALKFSDNSFLVQFARGKMIRFTYDPSVPAVPDIELKAYSLKDSYLLKKAISAYQAAHPEVYVKYEIGMDENSSVTREDALKKLNTEIVAGNGPDLMLLDDMPVDSYVDKGILMDMTRYLETLSEEEYFVNILKAFQKENGIYVLPAGFTLPLIVGNKEMLKNMNSLKGITEEMIKSRAKQPEGRIIGAFNEEQLLTKLLPFCANTWTKGSKEIEEAALKDFFTEAVGMWEIEKQGITEEMKQEYMDGQEEYRAAGMNESLTAQVLDYLVDEQEIVTGELGSDFDFSTVISSFRIKGKTNSGFAGYDGLTQNVFVPKTMIGINAASAYQEKAVELLTLILNEEADGASFPVNKAMWDNTLANPYPEEESFGSMMVDDKEGMIFSLNIYWPDEEEIERLRQIAEAANVPYIRNSVLEDAVCSIGTQILSGELGIDEGVAKIKKDLAIYMAE